MKSILAIMGTVSDPNYGWRTTNDTNIIETLARAVTAVISRILRNMEIILQYMKNFGTNFI